MEQAVGHSIDLFVTPIEFKKGRMKNTDKYILIMVCMVLFSCKNETNSTLNPNMVQNKEMKKKEVVYQVFTRLFGNTNTTNKPWGTLEENGVGKFADFTDKALKEIKDLGVTYIWYTGVPHHDVITDRKSVV